MNTDEATTTTETTTANEIDESRPAATTPTNRLDAAINAAKAKIAANGGITTSIGKRGRLTPEERARREEERKEALARRRAEREAKREAKRAQRQAEREANPAHMAKVAKAAQKLPKLTGAAQESFVTVTGNLSPADVFALAEHLQHWVRAQRTAAALETKLQVGDTVRIKSGAVAHVGQIGTVERAQRIRCYVRVPGQERTVYLFTSDCELIERGTVPADEPADEQEQEQATGT